MRNQIVLLVEDSPDDAALIQRAFKKSKITAQVMVARDGVEALDYLLASGVYGARDPDAMPTVVLLDLKMPKLDGFEVLRRLRSERRTAVLPVVMLSSSNEEQDIARAYTLGANSYVRKPVDFGELSEAVRLIGSYWLSLNETPPRPASGRGVEQ
jgi:CheY-like chemotaxis protein